MGEEGVGLAPQDWGQSHLPRLLRRLGFVFVFLLPGFPSGFPITVGPDCGYPVSTSLIHQGQYRGGGGAWLGVLGPAESHPPPAPASAVIIRLSLPCMLTQYCAVLMHPNAMEHTVHTVSPPGQRNITKQQQRADF